MSILSAGFSSNGLGIICLKTGRDLSTLLVQAFGGVRRIFKIYRYLFYIDLIALESHDFHTNLVPSDILL